MQYDFLIDKLDVLHKEDMMEIVTISPKFQVVIPKSIRKRLKLRPGQKIQAIAYGERIEFIPVRPARELRGVLRGLDTSFEREKEDRV